jgi:hypothetical protein
MAVHKRSGSRVPGRRPCPSTTTTAARHRAGGPHQEPLPRWPAELSPRGEVREGGPGQRTVARARGERRSLRACGRRAGAPPAVVHRWRGWAPQSGHSPRSAASTSAAVRSWVLLMARCCPTLPRSSGKMGNWHVPNGRGWLPGLGCWEVTTTQVRKARGGSAPRSGDAARPAGSSNPASIASAAAACRKHLSRICDQEPILSLFSNLCGRLRVWFRGWSRAGGSPESSRPNN